MSQPEHLRADYGDQDHLRQLADEVDLVTFEFESVPAETVAFAGVKPGMTVAENMGFALKIAGVGKEDRAKRVLEAAKLLDLEPYLGRKPKALSGGRSSGTQIVGWFDDRAADRLARGGLSRRGRPVAARGTRAHRHARRHRHHRRQAYAGWQFPRRLRRGGCA